MRVEVDRFAWERAFRSSGLPSGPLLAGVMVATYMNADGTGARPSIPTLAANMSMGERAARRHLRVLIDLGWLERVRRGHRLGDGTAVSSEYRAVIPQPVASALFNDISTGQGCPVEGASTGQQGPDELISTGQPARLNRTAGAPQQDSTTPPPCNDHVDHNNDNHARARADRVLDRLVDDVVATTKITKSEPGFRRAVRTKSADQVAALIADHPQATDDELLRMLDPDRYPMNRTFCGECDEGWLDVEQSGQLVRARCGCVGPQATATAVAS